MMIKSIVQKANRTIVPCKKPRETDSIVLGKKAKSQVRVGIQKNLFTHTGDSVPVISTPSGTPFHDLQIRGKGSFADEDEVGEDNVIVLEHAVTQMPVAIVRKHRAAVKDSFKIYTTRPVYSGQLPVENRFKYNQRMYSFAEVKRRGKVLNVVFAGQSAPTYTIHKIVSHASSRFPKSYVIKKLGEEVASTRSGEGHSNVLTVEVGVDPCLMICLAAIAEETNKESE